MSSSQPSGAVENAEMVADHAETIELLRALLASADITAEKMSNVELRGCLESSHEIQSAARASGRIRTLDAVRTQLFRLE